MSSNSLIESREDGTPTPYPLDTDSAHTLGIFATFLEWQAIADESRLMIDYWNLRIVELRRDGELDRAILVKFRMERWLPLDAMIWGIMEAYEDAYFCSSYNDFPCELNTREENPPTTPLAG